ncbi:MAG: sensor histidine kinase N-terminal domain-containing protein [Burkholderiaceae bacterium]|nr:sensor histidine kinase N-terminal domain-containing protein [Burkholderiaceae bacterium]
MSARPSHSLRARLLWLLLAAIVLTAFAQATIAYRTARAEADEIFDYHMQQMAMSLRSGLPANGSAGVAEDPNDAQDLNFVVQVWTAEGLRVFQSAGRAVLPQRATMGFSDLSVNGSTYRVFSMQSRSQIIQVAQDMAVRREMAGAMALRTMAPVAVMAPLLMLVVWWVVSVSFAPVSRMRRQVAQRQADELGELSEVDLPDEVRPLVHELNLLFGRVRQAFDAQNSFVADAAHELRSPLAALKLQAQGLQRAVDDAARDLAVKRLSAGIDRATRLVEQLLVLASHQGNAAGSRRERVSLAETARLAIVDAAPAARERQIDLGLGQADEGDIAGYPEALRILMRNLLDNAIKYTPCGGSVDLEIRREAGAMRLTVEDTGPGIAEADRDRVLDRFYRVAGTETTGSGLGLAIVKSIAEMHGATVQLDRSQRMGGLRAQIRFAVAGSTGARRSD